MEREIARFLSEQQETIIEAWNRRIILNLRSVAELLGVEVCREQTRHLLVHLIGLMKESREPEPLEEQDPVEKLSRQMAARRLTPGETARFIFSLKEVIFPLLGESFEDPLGAAAAVNEKIDEMGISALEVYLGAKEEIIADQQRAFQEISVPVVKIWDRIIMIPLVGMLDSRRTQLMMETLLSELEALQAKVAILDISGIPVVDTLVARHLITAASAVRLMGAECIITGIRARIAQTLVELGVDLEGFLTRSTLADGLSAALQRTGQSIGR